VTSDVVRGTKLTKEAWDERGPGSLTHPVVGVLVVKVEDSKCQIYTLGEVGLSQLSCADKPLARAVRPVGPDSSARGEELGADVRGGLSGFAEATSGCKTLASLSWL